MEKLGADIRKQIQTINVRKQEVTRLKAEADKLRGQADTACYKGVTKREYGFDGRKLIQEGKLTQFSLACAVQCHRYQMTCI